MAINSPARCCVPPLHRTSPSPRSILAPILLRGAPRLRLVSVRSQASGSEGLGSPKRRVSSERSHSSSSIGFSTSPPSSSPSSVIDFLTLCHRLKVTTITLTFSLHLKRSTTIVFAFLKLPI